ncbi:hypothetical protein CEXT_218321 [Caerostris extrusa]|uniref:Uncharacterized protein n=1 Tax=Caerostris extrusa TaxID=172846 RepID=A0AAV4UIP5_CAEEX|nr:hypothetical protein CEXT_218321 [Caerostris extrusa]
MASINHLEWQKQLPSPEVLSHFSNPHQRGNKKYIAPKTAKSSKGAISNLKGGRFFTTSHLSCLRKSALSEPWDPCRMFILLFRRFAVPSTRNIHSSKEGLRFCRALC